MPATGVSLRMLGELDEPARREKLAEIVRAAGGPANGELADLEKRIADFEKQFCMTSEVMIQRSRDHSLPETNETWEWMSMLEHRKRLASQGST